MPVPPPLPPATCPLLRRPAPARYFHPIFSNSSDFPPLGEVIKIYSPTFKKGGGANYDKSDVLTVLFVSESMCHKKRQLCYKCRQLRNAGKIHSTWFWNNSIDAKLNKRSQSTKIHHVIETLQNFLELTI